MRAPSLLVLCAVPFAATPLPAQSLALDPHLLSALVWRNVGPFRGGRISAVSGAIGQPGVFYARTPAGGGWETTKAGGKRVSRFLFFLAPLFLRALLGGPPGPHTVFV